MSDGSCNQRNIDIYGDYKNNINKANLSGNAKIAEIVLCIEKMQMNISSWGHACLLRDGLVLDYLRWNLFSLIWNNQSCDL